MIRPAHLQALAAGLACAAALSGCLTPRVKPTPSAAVIQARAAEGSKANACALGDLASVSPINVAFGFGETKLDNLALRRVAKAADWLKCNAGVEVVILPAADAHGTAAQQQDLASVRAKAVVDQLRALGAQPVIRILAAGKPDPVTTPHLVIEAQGRGW